MCFISWCYRWCLMNKETNTHHKKVCIVSEVNATVRPFFLAFVATQRELVDDGDQPINALHLELCKMDAPESKIWKLKRSACRTLSNIVKRISAHSTQWSDSHTRVGMLPLGGRPTWRGKVENLRACCCLHSSGSVSPVGCNRFRCLIWRLVFTPSPGQQWELAATTAAVWGEMTTPIVENTHKQTCDGLQRCSVLPAHTVYFYFFKRERLFLFVHIFSLICTQMQWISLFRKVKKEVCKTLRRFVQFSGFCAVSDRAGLK